MCHGDVYIHSDVCMYSIEQYCCSQHQSSGNAYGTAAMYAVTHTACIEVTTLDPPSAFAVFDVVVVLVVKTRVHPSSGQQ
jgi:hypothetical protein